MVPGADGKMVQGEMVGHDELRTRSEIENSKNADLYTFCTACGAL